MATKKAAYEAPAPASDKKKALETALAQIEKTYGKGAVMRLGDRPEMAVDAIPTGSLALDAALGIGGVPRGRIIEIYGPESSGKTYSRSFFRFPENPSGSFPPSFSLGTAGLPQKTYNNPLYPGP